MPMLTMFHPEAPRLAAPAVATSPASSTAGREPASQSHARRGTPERVAAAVARSVDAASAASASAASASAASASAASASAGGTEVSATLPARAPLAFRAAGNFANPYVEVAARLLSETAHDLRSPLTGVRELVRLLYDGDLGATTVAQREMLEEALGQCDVIASLIDNMLQLDRLRSGLPRTRRHWIIPTAIPKVVDAATRSVASARRIGIRWDGFDGRHGPMFVDEQLIHRLLANLICNAIAVSEEGRSVLVRLRPAAVDGMLRLSVSDQGPGVSIDGFTGMAGRGISGTGGSGLGLAISRTLAALHFGRLTVESKVGEGTQIGFEVPAAGPASVADALHRWRELSLPAGARPASVMGDQKSAIPFDGPPPRFPETAVIVTLRVGGKRGNSRSTRELEAMDDLLQSEQRLHELVYRTDVSRWVLLWDSTLEEARRRIASVESQLRKSAAELDLVWSDPAEQPIAGRANRTRIREWLVRDMLQASSRPVLGHDRGGWQLNPSEESLQVASRRLDAELLRLSHRLRRQTDQLQRQADRLAGVLKG